MSLILSFICWYIIISIQFNPREYFQQIPIFRYIELFWKHLSIAFGILEQTQQECGRFNWPSSLTIWVAGLRLGSPSDTSTEPSEWDGLFVRKHIFQVPLGLGKIELLNCLCCLPRILEVNSEVRTSCLASCIVQGQTEVRLSERTNNYNEEYP